MLILVLDDFGFRVINFIFFDSNYLIVLVDNKKVMLLSSLFKESL